MNIINHFTYGRKTKFVLLCGFCISVASFFTGCSGSLKLSSTWRQDTIVIDGMGTEWQRGLFYDKESDIAYSIRNDDEYVYLFLKTQNRSIQMNMIKAGFTVWFDAEGGKDHSFGVRYPLAGQGARSEFQPESHDEQIPSENSQALLELEIVGDKKEVVQRFSILDVPGIRVKIGRLQDALVYELRVPLRKTSLTPFAVGITTENRIGVGFEIEDDNRDYIKTGKHQNNKSNETESKDSQLEDQEPEGRGYKDTGYRGNIRGKKSQGQLELWLSVKLALSPNLEQKKKN
jgi:hypothetical protein